jgi:hypothetical protein
VGDAGPASAYQGGDVDRGEVIQLGLERGYRVERVWRNGQGGMRWQQVRLGQLADGRWFVQRSDATDIKCRAYGTRPRAYQVVRRLMTGGQWVEYPPV